MVLTRNQTYGILVLSLIIALVPTYLWLIPYDHDLGYGIFSNLVGMIGTIVFLMYLFETRDNHEWKPVKQKVYDRIGIELDAILNLSLDLFEPRWTVLKPPAIAIRLEDLVWLWSEKTNDSEFANALRESAKIELSEGKYLEIFETRRKLLNEIETKYSRFLQPDLTISLMEIQNNLLSITIYNNVLLRTSDKHQDLILEKISKKFHTIIKEIYKIHRMGIEILRSESFLDYHY